jgi:predicted nuclease with TOPRIM domain
MFKRIGVKMSIKKYLEEHNQKYEDRYDKLREDYLDLEKEFQMLQDENDKLNKINDTSRSQLNEEVFRDLVRCD